MLDYQKRVVDEKRELDDKIKKLRDFHTTDHYHALVEAEQQRLWAQLNVMQTYSSILGERIGAFALGD